MRIDVETLESGMVRVKGGQLTALAERILVDAGTSEEEARLVAQSLVEADLRGVNSHGILRLPVYVERLKSGGFTPRAQIQIVGEAPSTALLDAGNSLGAVATSRAMQIAIEKAAKSGIGAVGVRNSNHNGESAHYVRQAAAADMIGIATTNSSPIMPVWGGRDPITGPLPIAFGIPTGAEPILLDMALGMSSRGKILYHLEKGKELPPGWLVDAEGRPTTDPSWINKGGWILPIGGYKGWGLILMCEILSGILTGGSFGRELTNLYENVDTPQRNGHLVIALNIASFIDVASFKERVTEYIGVVKASELAPGFDEILMPGEIEARRHKQQDAEGITLSSSVMNSLLDLAGGLTLEVADAN